MAHPFILRRWSAWAPGLLDQTDWQSPAAGRRPAEDQAPPALQYTPKPLQRRLSPLARAAFFVIEQCLAPGERLAAVFSSSHGEIGSCLDMLQDLQHGEELSPTAFSLSVHNAIAGLYSIAYANQLEINCLAPAAAGLGPGFIEALGLLHSGHDDVLLVFYDTVLPNFFPTPGYASSLAYPCAAALRLALDGPGLALAFAPADSTRQDGEQPLQLPAFIEFLAGDRSHLDLGNGGRGWQWRKL
ncbi:beta-ketoacyl synthase chain length factor [Methylomonas koyamae]|uniref:beta-ketoacyl synthase chain length factor n=1 Tax=Methylomonas koyamae TaxID=702114 RepID=UPI0028736E09|nr:beta-ketoacyl synthase chain length factor [Methylomonas koyamae]WNB75065.1 beta-ketoacyl synthase chain length factor [Methylomonas koyamae]